MQPRLPKSLPKDIGSDAILQHFHLRCPRKFVGYIVILTRICRISQILVSWCFSNCRNNIYLCESSFAPQSQVWHPVVSSGPAVSLANSLHLPMSSWDKLGQGAGIHRSRPAQWIGFLRILRMHCIQQKQRHLTLTPVTVPGLKKKIISRGVLYQESSFWNMLKAWNIKLYSVYYWLFNHIQSISISSFSDQPGAIVPGCSRIRFIGTSVQQWTAGAGFLNLVQDGLLSSRSRQFWWSGSAFELVAAMQPFFSARDWGSRDVA